MFTGWFKVNKSLLTNVTKKINLRHGGERYKKSFLTVRQPICPQTQSLQQKQQQCCNAMQVILTDFLCIYYQCSNGCLPNTLVYSHVSQTVAKASFQLSRRVDLWSCLILFPPVQRTIDCQQCFKKTPLSCFAEN